MANSGPLSRDQALAALDHAAELMSNSQFVDAARLYQRVIGFDDRGVTAAAMLGFGQAMHRLGDEDQAIGAWQEVVSLPATPATYPAWRELAGARVRKGDLPAAVEAYRQADQRAPQADKAEIASRLGWLSKEMGDPKAAGRYFSQARGGSAIAMTLAIMAVTIVVSLVADIGGSDGNKVLETLQLDKVLVAHGQLYRLATAALVHASLAENPLHLVFNMYWLWIIGPIVERLYGRWRLLAFYVVFAVAGSLLSFAMATDPGHTQLIDGIPTLVSDRYVVGASGALFGLIGLVISSVVIQRPMIGGNARILVVNLVVLSALNLYLGLTTQFVDNWAHIGGLVAGLWFGLVFIPTGVPVLKSLWLRPGEEPGTAVPLLGSGGMLAVRVAGVVGLLIAFVLLWHAGSTVWGQVAL